MDVGERKFAEWLVREGLASREQVREQVQECLAILQELRAVGWVLRYKAFNLPDADEYIHRGLVRHSSGDLEGAIGDFTRALEINPRKADAYTDRGLAREALAEKDAANAREHLKAAEADLVKALEVAPPNWPHRRDDEGILKRVREQLAKLEKGFDSQGEGVVMDGGMPQFAKRLEKLIEDCTRALEINPRDAGAYTNRGLARLISRDLEGPIEDFTRALEINPRDAEAYYNRGVVRQASGDLPGAIEDFTRALEINPRDTDAYIYRGVVRQVSEDFPGAIEDFTRAIEINPRDADAYIYRGSARAHSGDLPGAIEDFTRALEIDPRNADACIYSGVFRKASGDLPGAIEDFTRALEIDPRDAGVYLNRGLAREALAEKDAANEREHLKAAEADLVKALEVAPPNWEYRRYAEGTLKRVRELLSEHRVAVPRFWEGQTVYVVITSKEPKVNAEGTSRPDAPHA